MLQFQTKQHNTRNAFKATLYEPNGLPVNLTDCEVLFRMRSNKQLVINRSMSIGENGEVIIVFHSDEVANSGTFLAEINVIYPDGRKEIYPNSGYIRVFIQSSLGGEENAI